MLARLRSQLFQQRRSIGHSSRKIPKSQSPTPDPLAAPRRPSTSPTESSIPPSEFPPSESSTDAPKDFRSPWLFKAVGVGNFIVIPVVGVYAAFYWDWGDDDRDHVMKPARRWFKRQKDAFFSLSPPEQELATPGLVVPPLSGEEPTSTSGLSTAGLPKGFFKPFFLVKGVDPAGPAAIAGLRDDDLIVTFGETPVRDLAPLKYQAMISTAIKEQATIPVVVMRPGKHVLLSVNPTKEAGLGCDLQRFQPGQVNR
ncbi:hypothetical protein B0H17DRAFT_1079347 [Mycena rosella]|uniref:PDZ domain-containing protein n=1 Tax=Mycena rosella TaxID=1033263 RepID=A0AAD7D409_MYCRO|nr:hypothetical protein B0H17DRAFT_1079347 [Mycena rosella]